MIVRDSTCDIPPHTGSIAAAGSVAVAGFVAGRQSRLPTTSGEATLVQGAPGGFVNAGTGQLYKQPGADCVQAANALLFDEGPSSSRLPQPPPAVTAFSAPIDFSQPVAATNPLPFVNLPVKLEELHVVCYGDFPAPVRPLPFLAREEHRMIDSVLGLSMDPRRGGLARLYLHEHTDYRESPRLLVALFDQNDNASQFSTAKAFAFGLLVNQRRTSTVKLVAVNAKMQHSEQRDGRWGSMGIELRQRSAGVVSVYKPISNSNPPSDGLHVVAGRFDGSQRPPGRTWPGRAFVAVRPTRLRARCCYV